MNIILVDNNQTEITSLSRKLRILMPDADIQGFPNAKEAFSHFLDNHIDIAIIDMHIREIEAFILCEWLRKIHPKLRIIITAYNKEQMYDAINKVHCSGYLLKPVNMEELEDLFQSEKDTENNITNASLPYIQCFGNFEIFLRGVPLLFRTKKTKEMVAYMIDRCGAMCSNDEIAAALWEDDKDHKSYLKKLRKDLRDVLAEHGIEQMIIYGHASMAINQKKIECDYYQWKSGIPAGRPKFNGEYMEQYSWAERTKGYLINN